MYDYQLAEKLTTCIEEEFEGYEIYIENNPDIYRGGFEWCISKDEILWDSGISFNIEDAIAEAKNSVVTLKSNECFL